jgi:outer membrane protein assembly factor BamB
MPWLRSLTVLALLAGLLPAEEWPQWLGPRRDGTSTEKVAPWKNPPKSLWKQPVGAGHSSPIVADGKVFLHTQVNGKDQEQVAAHDAATGKQLWAKTYDRGKLHQGFIKQFGTGPRATPTYHQGKLYTNGVTGMLICWDAKDGKKLWSVDTSKDFSPPPLRFGVSCSPLIEGEKVLINVGAKGASIVAFNKDTGKVIWRSLDDPPSYSSPIAFGQGKVRQLVFLTEEGLVSVEPASGKQFWRVPLKDILSESSTTPVKSGDWLLGSSVTFGSLGVKLSTKDGKPAATRQWMKSALTCWFSTPVPISPDHIYMVNGVMSLLKPPTSTLRCVEIKTGKVLWSKPDVARYHAALLKTGDGKLLMLDDLGHLSLLQPDPKAYKALSQSTVCGPTWAHPALSSGRLYLRDNNNLICLDLGGSK